MSKVKKTVDEAPAGPAAERDEYEWGGLERMSARQRAAFEFFHGLFPKAHLSAINEDHEDNFGVEIELGVGIGWKHKDAWVQIWRGGDCWLQPSGDIIDFPWPKAPKRRSSKPAGRAH